MKFYKDHYDVIVIGGALAGLSLFSAYAGG